MGRLFKSYIVALIGASVVQAMAVSYMFGAQSCEAKWSRVMYDLYDELYPELHVTPGILSHPLSQPLGTTSFILLGLWFLALAAWLAGRE